MSEPSADREHNDSPVERKENHRRKPFLITLDGERIDNPTIGECILAEPAHKAQAAALTDAQWCALRNHLDEMDPATLAWLPDADVAQMLAQCAKGSTGRNGSKGIDGKVVVDATPGPMRRIDAQTFGTIDESIFDREIEIAMSGRGARPSLAAGKTR
jgi:hypothetical protein